MNAYPAHTPELARLLADMLRTGEALKRVAKRDPLAAFKSPEYKASKVAYNTYWDAVEADKAAKV